MKQYSLMASEMVHHHGPKGFVTEWMDCDTVLVTESDALAAVEQAREKGRREEREKWEMLIEGLRRGADSAMALVETPGAMARAQGQFDIIAALRATTAPAEGQDMEGT